MPICNPIRGYARRAEVRAEGSTTGPPEPKSASQRVEEVGVVGHEEVDGLERLVRLHPEADDRLARADSAACRRAWPPAGTLPLPVVSTISPEHVGDQAASGLPDARAGVAGLARLRGSRASRLWPAGREADHPSLVVGVVAVPAEPGVDDPVHQQQAGALQVRRGIERHPRVVGRGALQPQREAGAFGSGRGVDGVGPPGGGA